MKRCLVISDSFKGTLSSPAICRIARSLAVPGWQVDALPVADGGEGTVDCFLDACGGRRVTVLSYRQCKGLRSILSRRVLPISAPDERRLP